MPFDNATSLSYCDVPQSLASQSYVEPSSALYDLYNNAMVPILPNDTMHPSAMHFLGGENMETKSLDLPVGIDRSSAADGNSVGDEDSGPGIQATKKTSKKPDQDMQRPRRNLRKKKRCESSELEELSHSAKDSQQDSPDPDASKRALQARNRTAAAKCRVRKKHNAKQLEKAEAKLREENRTLHEEACQLQEETLKLKHTILDHAACGSEHINKYIQHIADSLSDVSRVSQVSTSPKSPSVEEVVE